ncbi:hypothetical protein B296_00052556 [Ensete ventricosum]|uniref:Uncharacterized protein n=1 Tax=Ensete ventricosum TaxID=4639 RepID=A0A426X4B9_ENSVE|nr:hypothetical protein B296_00052556 [Ensete ventricosum]
MTSLGLFEPKLEVVEMRMDAKLCTLFEEFRLGQSPSPRRSQHGANSDCKKNPSEIRSEDTTRQPYTSTMSISFVQLQEGHLNQDVQSMRATFQPKLNHLWFLIQCSLISDYLHDFTEERTMMLKVFPDDDLGPTAHERKKEQEKGIHMIPQP